MQEGQHHLGRLQSAFNALLISVQFLFMVAALLVYAPRAIAQLDDVLNVPASELTQQQTQEPPEKYSNVRGDLSLAGTGSFSFVNSTRQAILAGVGITNNAGVTSGGILIVAVLAHSDLVDPHVLALWQSSDTVPAHSTRTFSGTAPMQVVPNGVYHLYFVVYEQESNYADAACANGYCPDYISGAYYKQVVVTNGNVDFVETTTPPPIAPQIGLWWNPNESGTGYALDYKNGTLVITTYSFHASGPAQWYISSGLVTNNVFTAPLSKFEWGQCISCPYRVATATGSDGSMTIHFTGSRVATMTLPGRAPFTIVPYF